MKWNRINNLIRIHFYRILFTIIGSAIICTIFHQVYFGYPVDLTYDENYNERSGSTVSENSTIIDTEKQLKRESSYDHEQMKTRIKLINLSQTVYNLAMGAVHPLTNVVVIQVHSNVFYFRQLLESMKNANGIRNSLLIFSHDYWDDEINKIVKTIDYVRYIQIFYPCSLQLYPNVFPGEDSKLCTKGSGCRNSTLRDPKASQAKLHWWWLVNQVFDHMPIISNYHNDILFLEEGNYVTKDFLYTFRSIQDAKRQYCPYCEFISLAANIRPNTYQYRKVESTVLVRVWTDDMPKTGLAFDREIWVAVKSWSKDFCYYNDSRWDKSLKNLKIRKWNRNMYVIAIKGPRVFTIDECDESFGCNTMDEVQKFVQTISKELFPRNLILGVRKEREMNDSEPPGDWLDVRDQELCMHFSKRSLWY